MSVGLPDDALGLLYLQSQCLLLQALVVEVSLLIQNLRLHLVDVSLVVVDPDVNLKYALLRIILEVPVPGLLPCQLLLQLPDGLQLLPHLLTRLIHP